MSPLLRGPGLAVPLVELSAALLLGTLAGAAVPLLFRPRPHQTDLTVAFAAGVLLGTVGFHLLPEALRGGGLRVLWGVGGGALALFLAEHALRGRRGGHLEVHAMMHGEAAHDGEGQAETGGAQDLGLVAFAGLSLHTVSDGLALGSALGTGRPALVSAVFTAIFAHQLPTAFALSALLRRGGRSATVVLAASGVVALMVPVGATLYLGAATALGSGGLLAWVLAFSAGNFLHLAFGDLLPDLRRSGASRGGLATSVAAGVAVIGLLRLAFD